MRREVVDHEGVDARVQARAEPVVVRQPQLVAGVEVRRREAAEAELVLEQVGQHRLVDVHLHALPRAVRHHDRADVLGERRLVRRQVERAQRGLVAGRVGAGLAHRGAAVAEVVLRAGDDAGGLQVFVELQAANQRRAHLRRQLGRLAEGFVGAAPALVARDRDHRRERKVEAAARRLLRGHAPDLLDQRDVARGAEADVVREYRRALDRPDAVNDVDAVDDRDLQAARQRALAKAVGHVGPPRRRVVDGRRSALAVEQPDAVLPELRRRHLEALELHDLRDLLVEGHLRDQTVRHVEAGLRRERPGQRRPPAAPALAALPALAAWPP